MQIDHVPELKQLVEELAQSKEMQEAEFMRQVREHD